MKIVENDPSVLAKICRKYFDRFLNGTNCAPMYGTINTQGLVGEVTGICDRVIGDVCRYIDENRILMPMTGEETKKLDTIDASKLFDRSTSREHGRNIITLLPKPVYSGIGNDVDTSALTAIDYLPCFEKGRLIVAKKRSICWEIQKLDIQESGIDASIRIWDCIEDDSYCVCCASDIIKLSDFLGNDENGHPIICKFSMIYNGKKAAEYADKNIKLMKSLYKWGDRESFLFDVAVKDYIRDKIDGFYCRDYFPAVFLNTIMHINHILSDNKGKSMKKRDSGTIGNMERKNNTDSVQPGCITRTICVGGKNVSFTSKSRPRPASASLVRTYSVAQWKRKATVRKYKSGKTAYIRETVCHRKGFETDGTDVPQRVIRIKNNTGKKKHEDGNAM